MSRHDSPHARIARLNKSRKILAVLDEAADGRITSAELQALNDTDLARAAVLAGCRPASLETRALVAEIVRERESLSVAS